MHAPTARDTPTTLAPGFTGVAGAAHYSDLSERTLWRLIEDGRLPSHRVGRRVLVRISDLDALITGQGQD